MKKLIILLVIILAIAGVILLIPGTYNLEQAIDINAPQARVFAAARNLPSWHLIGMMGMMQSVKKMPKVDMGTMMKNAPKEVQDKLNAIPGGAAGFETMMSGMGKMQNLLTAMKISVKSSTPPGTIVMKIEGGPIDGAEPQLAVEKTDAAKSRVVYRETYQFTGFLSGFKAFAAKRVSSKLAAMSLGNLKKACER